MRGILRHIVGWGCLLLGAAGLFLPVVQGWLFIGLGALLLSPDVQVFRRLVSWIERRFPALKRGFAAVRKRLRLEP